MPERKTSSQSKKAKAISVLKQKAVRRPARQVKKATIKKQIKKSKVASKLSFQSKLKPFNPRPKTSPLPLAAQAFQTTPSSSSSSSSSSGIKVTFDPSPIYTGYTNPASSSVLHVTVTAHVTPPSQVSNIQLQMGGAGADRALLANIVPHSDGTITADLYGQIASPGNLKNSDCLLWAVYTGGAVPKVIAYAPCWVVVPTAIGRPHPTKSGVVGHINQDATGSTSPAYFGSLANTKVVLWTYWAQWLDIPVVDQFYNAIISLYDGQAVFELINGDWLPINQHLSGAKYKDPVFVFQYKNDSPTPYIVAAGSSEANAWPSKHSATFPLGFSEVKNLSVQIAGFELQAVDVGGKTMSSPAIQNRQVSAPNENEVDVTWP